MKFSIVTISYNQAPFLEQAIRSVIEQDYPNIEYIVVDPGSSDGSREIVERYRDRIDKIIFEPDNGPADGLNKGFTQATGEIFGFLNSDDFLFPGTVSFVASAFRQHRSIDIISGHGWIVDEKGERRRRIYSDRFSLKMAAYGACILVQPSSFFRSTSFWKAGGFNVENRSNWDGELFINMALSRSEFLTVNAMLSAYRVHAGSITGSAKLRKLHKVHRERMLEKILGRRPNAYDRYAADVCAYVRKILNPRDTYERIVRGPVFGSSAPSVRS